MFLRWRAKYIQVLRAYFNVSKAIPHNSRSLANGRNEQWVKEFVSGEGTHLNGFFLTPESYLNDFRGPQALTQFSTGWLLL